MSREDRLVPKRRFDGYTDDWEQCNLDEIADIVGGGTPSTIIEDYWDGDIDWYAPAEIDGQIYAKTSVRKITELGLKNSSAKMLPADKTILFTSRAGIGKTAILSHSGSTNQGFQSLVLNEGYNPYFVYSMSREIKDKAEAVASGSTFLEISGKMLGKLEIMVPDKPEQDDIAKLFERIDNLISLHQRKLEKMQELKKAYLSEMFPTDGESIPKRRFAGFTDDWEQCKFKNVFNHLQNNSLSRALLDYEEGEVFNVHYGDILVKYGECLDIKLETLPRIRNNDFCDKYRASYLENGDVIVADAAEDETVGKCCEIKGLENELILSGLHTIPCRPLMKFATGYLGYFMNSNAYHDQLLPLMQGTKVSSISKSAITDTYIKYPKDIKEQEKIGRYFIGLDNLITLHQHKLNKLKATKKAYLNEMFV